MRLNGKILIVSSEYFPIPAAAASRVIPWVNELLKLSFQPLVLSSSTVDKNDKLVEKSFFPTPNNKATLPVRLAQEFLLGLDLGLRVFVKKKKVCLCIITSPPFFMACICAIFARISNVAYIFDVRDRYPRVLSDLKVVKLQSLLGRALQSLESWVYEGAKQVTTVTNGLLTELRNEFPNIDVRLLRNGFDEEIFSKELLIQEKADFFTVVYHGRLGRFYDRDAYLKVIDIVGELDPEIRFLMIGDLPRELFLHQKPNLTVLPMMNLENLSVKLASCQLGICLLRDLPAMKSAFPAKAYDYIGAGLPQLVGPEGELSETISKSGIGVSFKKINPHRIARTIIEIKNNPDKLLAMRDQVNLDRNNYGRRKLAQSYFQSIHKIL
jgi:glycosyltransferase involved in cell wall biosynthesis